VLDDLNELKTFRAILAEGSLSAAARRMGVTLAVVSKPLYPSAQHVPLKTQLMLGELTAHIAAVMA
jgi:Bacterial regulatory helix-turn-helix protein, lysR family